MIYLFSIFLLPVVFLLAGIVLKLYLLRRLNEIDGADGLHKADDHIIVFAGK